MRIAMLDLMPILWGMCAAAALALAFYGEKRAPARVFPAVVGALLVYFFGKPPRLQALVFAVMYAIAAIVWAVLSYADSKKQRKTDLEKQDQEHLL